MNNWKNYYYLYNSVESIKGYATMLESTDYLYDPEKEEILVQFKEEDYGNLSIIKEQSLIQYLENFYYPYEILVQIVE
jgi:hypothetical protein